MRRRIALVSLAVVALGFGGCGGSSKKSTTTAAAPTPATTSTSTSAPSTVPSNTTATIKPRTYAVKMAGANEVPSGAPNASATAVISIKASKQLCWKFTNLSNVTAPKMAHIHQAPAGKAGAIVIPLGTTYKASGCVPSVAPTLLSQIESDPKGFYVNIHNAKYPGGVVRAQL
jgi:uncharacterized membrane protein